MQPIASVTQTFRQVFGETPTLRIASPGRINLIGEHTDYNQGFVLPAAIDRAVFVAIAASENPVIELIAADLNETYTCPLDAIAPTRTWADYALGVADQWQQAGYTLSGFRAVIGGTIPMGAGLSSSAALENAIGFGLNELFGQPLDRLGLIRLSQRAENRFVGANVGIMDMFASMMGRADHVIQLDCRSLAYTYAPLPLDTHKLVLCDTRVKHALVASEYNTRRAECEAGVRLLQQHYPDIESLRDVTPKMLEQHLRKPEPLLYKRCAFVVAENNRVLETAKALEANRLYEVGQLMYASHDGLSHNYEVSCPELDLLVSLARQQPGVLGARMMGGGFGGCTINLVCTNALADFTTHITDQYRNATGLETLVHVCRLENGTHLITDSEI